MVATKAVLGNDLISSLLAGALCSGESKGTPQCQPPKEKKAWLRGLLTIIESLSLDNPLIRPYFLRGGGIGGAPWLCVFCVFFFSGEKEESETHINLNHQSWKSSSQRCCGMYINKSTYHYTVLLLQKSQVANHRLDSYFKKHLVT